jgi:hypothetical protein
VSDPFYGRPVSKAAQFDEANMVVLCQSTTRRSRVPPRVGEDRRTERRDRVRAEIAAFNRGDIEALLDLAAPDVEVVSPEEDWSRCRAIRPCLLRSSAGLTGLPGRR